MKKKKLHETAAFKRKLNVILRIIGNNLRMLRQMRKESLKTTAKAAYISASYLSRIERGLAPNFNLTVLGLLSRYFEVNMSDIVTRGLKSKLKELPHENR
jgi:transcriptional regulator with XRE-family HTH domain